MNVSENCAAISPPPLQTTAALYLDFDGTLTELALRPDAVQVPPQLLLLLLFLRAQHNGAVAILTGRRLAQVDALLTPLRLPGCGVHGAELRLHADQPARLVNLRTVTLMVHKLRKQLGPDKRLLIEDKGAAVALHYRLAPERAEECIQTLQQLSAVHGLEIVHGKMVVEAREPGASKGRSLRMMSRQSCFIGRLPVFIGDDGTDEDAFEAVNELYGISIKVGAGETAARYRLNSVNDVYTWLCNSSEITQVRYTS